MENEFKVLGRKVKFLRLEKGISQTDMAEAIGLSQTNLSNMESGRTAITIQNLFKMQKILGCKMSDFFADFDGEVSAVQSSTDNSNAIELEDSLNILKLLKKVNVKGL